MKSSGSSSAFPPLSQPSAAPPRRSFALTGHSVALDPRRDAVRPDLADIRLADRVFAPHYAAPVARYVLHQTDLREASDPASASLAQLDVGATFDVLEFAKGIAWGVAPAIGMVGYVDTAALSWSVK